MTNDVLGVLLVMRDIKERRVAEKTKRELEKNKGACGSSPIQTGGGTKSISDGTA